MIKFLLFILVSVSFMLHTTPSFAALDTCDEKTYCERNKDGTEKGLIKKSGCVIASEFVDQCIENENSTGQDCKTTGRKICNCNYETVVANSCGNPGGTKDVSNNLDSVFGRIMPPISGLGTGMAAVNGIIGRIIQLLYTIAGIGALFMFLWSGLQLILSGGDKEALGTARKRITWAIIGLALLAMAFPIMKILGESLNIPLFK